MPLLYSDSFVLRRKTSSLSLSLDPSLDFAKWLCSTFDHCNHEQGLFSLSSHVALRFSSDNNSWSVIAMIKELALETLFSFLYHKQCISTGMLSNKNRNIEQTLLKSRTLNPGTEHMSITELHTRWIDTLYPWPGTSFLFNYVRNMIHFL